MANTDWPRGFRPIVNSGGNSNTVRTRMYAVSATNANAIYEGDLLYKTAIGVDAFTAAAELTATHNAKTHNIVGVAAHYVPATPGAGTEIAVYDDPDQLFLVQEDGNAVSTTTNVIEVQGQLCKPLLATGNTTTLQSKHELDSSELTSAYATDTGIVLQIVGVHDRVGQVVSGSYTELVVRIHPINHLYGSGVVAKPT